MEGESRLLEVEDTDPSTGRVVSQQRLQRRGASAR
jgi:hypothetical protein